MSPVEMREAAQQLRERASWARHATPRQRLALALWGVLCRALGARS